jgi:hypothetical protein
VLAACQCLSATARRQETVDDPLVANQGAKLRREGGLGVETLEVARHRERARPKRDPKAREFPAKHAAEDLHWQKECRAGMHPLRAVAWETMMQQRLAPRVEHAEKEECSAEVHPTDVAQCAGLPVRPA